MADDEFMKAATALSGVYALQRQERCQTSDLVILFGSSELVLIPRIF